ncbi:MAG: ATPase, partial [Proteobacteria bacterium]|nr:ATPase [Pseudomonadota bacterium]
MIDLLGQRVLKKGLISRDELAKAYERQRLLGGKIGSNLIALGLITESDLTNFFKFTPHEPSNVSETNIETGFITDL